MNTYRQKKLYCMYSLFLLSFIRNLDFVCFCNLQINPSSPYAPQKNDVGQLGKTLKSINLHTTFQARKLQKKKRFSAIQLSTGHMTLIEYYIYDFFC